MGTGWVPAAFQPGMVQWTAASSAAPVGWLAADGRPYSRTLYAALFAQVGTAYGSGDGSTTFNVPDLRGRAAIGASASGTAAGLGLTLRRLADRAGSETHPLSVGEMPSHTHGVNDPGHNHGGATANGAADRPYPAWASWYDNEANSTYGNAGYSAVRNFGGNHNGLHAHGIPVGGTGIWLSANGSGSAHNNMQPSLALHAWIKT